MALPGGGGGGGGPAPVQPPPAPVLTAPAPILASTCAHTPGAGREFNVGGPAGTPNRVDQIQEIPWEGLVPGDTVRIHWQAQPYAARLPLLRSGTAAHPIRVCGVLGGATGDQRPRITGRQAVTRQAPALQNGKQADLAAYGIVTITGNSFESRVEHVIVEGLRIGDTKNGDGTNSGADNAAFINANGQPAQYVTAAACIRMRQAAHITIRNNEIDNCGDGIFAGSLADNENHIVRHLLVEGNYLHGNAIIGNESRHQAYLQGVDITVQSNYFGQVRTNGSGVASGNQLKTRAAGLVVRYNYFLNGARSLDMVEAEEHSWMILPWKYQRHRARYLACQQNGCLKLNAQELAEYDARHVQDWAKYQAAYVYGNLFHVRGRSDAGARLPTNLVHYGYDNVQHDRQAGTAWFFHNT
ncbi:MAG TPA: hypothetical protein VFH35_11600, partial [Ramlibacter sp.]|nr:hypothetical protein [Ramlibacter sp.]